MTVQELFEASKKLSSAERFELAERIYDDLSPPQSEMTREELVTMLNQRAKELEENPEIGIPANKVFEKAERFLAERGLR